MKLYVVGEDAPDPSKWSIWSEWSLVLAGTPDQARELAGESAGALVCEIPLDKPIHLVTMPEPAWGDDL